MDQSQNNSNTNSPVEPVVPPPAQTPVTPTIPSVEPTVTPSTPPTTPTPAPADIPPVPPPVVDDTSSGDSSMSRIVFLAIALLLVLGALYGGYWYMNQQTNSISEPVVITPTQVQENKMVTPTSTATNGATLQEEQDLKTVNLGSDEAQITDIQKDLNGL